uniref:Uncharacterized protein n=1 Tax=Alexandrium catenella TaxID=2925 RepID=A0A7S1RXL7_ALECA|mmetsp:Transcript_75109/g.199457  ORF Transcript_75109/g.199457 Transcript_75109/m.199457 type:complete len:107 (+) Transcript_75109:2-322(+)
MLSSLQQDHLLRLPPPLLAIPGGDCMNGVLQQWKSSSAFAGTKLCKGGLYIGCLTEVGKQARCQLFHADFCPVSIAQLAQQAVAFGLLLVLGTRMHVQLWAPSTEV